MKNSPLTFLFTDIEGSRQLWDRYPEAMRTALARHDALLRQSVEMYHGTIYRSIDGACQAVFSAASYAAAAALAAQLPGQPGDQQRVPGVDTGEMHHSRPEGGQCALDGQQRYRLGKVELARP